MISSLRFLVFLSACLLASCQPGAAQTTNPEQLFQEAVAAQQRGDDAVAAQKYRLLLRQHPEAIAVRVNLGATLADMKQFHEAAEQFRAVLDGDPANRMARLNLAIAYRGEGNLSESVKSLEQLHNDAPEGSQDDGQAALLLGDCYVQLKRYADAIALLMPLESAQSDNADLEWPLGSALIHTGRATEGVVRVEKAAETGANAEAYLLAAQTRLSMGQYDLARRDADTAMKVDPELAGLKTTSGMILEQTGDYTEAKTLLQQALAKDPNDFNAHLYLGGIYYFERDMAKARLQLTRALQLQPDATQARYELALVARADGRLNAALEDLQTVVRQSPDWLQPHVELSALYYRLHRPEDGAREREIVDRMMAVQQQNQSQAAH